MIAYLSPEWLSAADDALRRSPLLSEPPLVLDYVVREVPDHGTVRYHIAVDADGARLGVGAAVAPHVGFELDHATAHAVAAGEVSAQQAFIDGRLRLTGDAQALLGRLELLAALDDRLVDLRPAPLDRSTAALGD